MSDINPYQPPSSDVSLNVAPDSPLASRWQRLGASIIDTIILLIFMVPVMFMLGSFEYVQQGIEPPFTVTLTTSVISFAVYILLNYALLNKYGQTIGKKLLNIRIADMMGNKPDVSTILFKRYLPVSAVSLIPLIGQFLTVIDVLFVFRGDRRCVHDLIAGTQVLRVKR